MDISLQAVEDQWAVAQANDNTPRATLAIARAQLVATLLAAGYGAPTDVVPPELQAQVDVFAEAKKAHRGK